MEDLKNIKKIILEDWKNAFPELSEYSTTKLYKVIGPIVVGLELIRLPREEKYRHHFVCYPLWETDDKLFLEAPLILHQFYNNKGFQFSIPYRNHTSYFAEAIECTKKQFPVALNRDVLLMELFSFIDKFTQTSPWSAAPNSYFQAQLQETKLYFALYTGSEYNVQNVLNEIKKRKWDLNHFSAFKVDFDVWLLSLEKAQSQRDDIVMGIKEKLQNKKLAKLNVSEIIK